MLARREHHQHRGHFAEQELRHVGQAVQNIVVRITVLHVRAARPRAFELGHGPDVIAVAGFNSSVDMVAETDAIRAPAS